MRYVQWYDVVYKAGFFFFFDSKVPWCFAATQAGHRKSQGYCCARRGVPYFHVTSCGHNQRNGPAPSMWPLQPCYSLAWKMRSPRRPRESTFASIIFPRNLLQLQILLPRGYWSKKSWWLINVSEVPWQEPISYVNPWLDPRKHWGELRISAHYCTHNCYCTTTWDVR